jgi:type II secretory pathway predicted ATPase ExeA
MYLEYFGLSKPPFRITPDTHAFFEGSGRGPILNAPIFAIQNGEGIIKVVGELGTVKTMRCRGLPTKFVSNIASAIEKYSHGLSRRINILADKALLTAYAGGTYNVTVREIKAAAEDSQYAPRKRRWPWSESMALILICLGVLTTTEQTGTTSFIPTEQIADALFYDH